MKKNNEIRNDELKTAMIKIKLQGDYESEQEFVKEIKKAIFLVPMREEEKVGYYSFMLLRNKDKENYFQAYTDKEAYDKWNDADTSKKIVLSFDEYASTVLTSEEEIKGLVINPFTENIIMDRDVLAKIFVRGKFFINESKKCPLKLKSVVKEALKKYDEVDMAYLLSIIKEGEEGYLLIIDAKVKDEQKLYDAIFKDISKNIDQINLDILSYSDEITEEIIEEIKPFYKKSK